MLPYKTVVEAETAIGRSLTTAETLWLNHTANKSDYLLYCYNILFLFIIFSLCPLYYVFIEYLFKNSIRRYKIQPKIELSYGDMLKCYRDVLRMFILVVGPLQLVSYPSIQVIFCSFKLLFCFNVSDVLCVWLIDLIPFSVICITWLMCIDIRLVIQGELSTGDFDANH